jgi:hypothetical protein
MRILACGDRNYTDLSSIGVVLLMCRDIFGDFTLIHGACRGADRIAGEASITMEMITIAVPARWSRDGRKAGPLRNQVMLDKGRPDLVLAFHDHIEDSRGTHDMIRRAKRAGLPVVLVKSDSDMSQIRKSLEDARVKC